MAWFSMNRPCLLDLYCGAGGAGMGYHRAGFDVVGVDIRPQPRYPFGFVQADALEYVAAHGHEFDAIHASPPCQLHSRMRKGRWKDREHPELIGPTRDLLIATGKPYIIENVEDARDSMIEAVMLCGTMFSLQTADGAQLRRHRLFEIGFPRMIITPPCSHNDCHPIGVYGGGQHPNRRSSGASYGVDARRSVMGIDWMTAAELSQSIPPAYTAFLGLQLFAYLQLQEN